MFPVIYPLNNAAPNPLWLCGRPSPDWLADDVAQLANAGARSWLCLMEQAEMNNLGIEALPRVVQDNHMQFLHYPIRDRGLPTFNMHELIERLEEGLTLGPVVVHCRAGIGRTGVVAATLLIRQGIPAAEAIERVSVARRVSVPDTAAQRQWLLNIAD